MRELLKKEKIYSLIVKWTDKLEWMTKHQKKKCRLINELLIDEKI